METRLPQRHAEGEGAVKFTEEEAQAILAQLNSGRALTHELAKRYHCDPSDIWALWDERNRER